MRELKRGSSSKEAQAREPKQGRARRQAGKQALGGHSVGAMPWRGLFKLSFLLWYWFCLQWDYMTKRLFNIQLGDEKYAVFAIMGPTLCFDLPSNYHKDNITEKVCLSTKIYIFNSEGA